MSVLRLHDCTIARLHYSTIVSLRRGYGCRSTILSFYLFIGIECPSLGEP